MSTPHLKDHRPGEIPSVTPWTAPVVPEQVRADIAEQLLKNVDLLHPTVREWLTRAPQTTPQTHSTTTNNNESPPNSKSI